VFMESAFEWLAGTFLKQRALPAIFLLRSLLRYASHATEKALVSQQPLKYEIEIDSHDGGVVILSKQISETNINRTFNLRSLSHARLCSCQ
jgi:hypothetical protein